MKKASLLLLPSLALIALLWLPFGFHMGGLIEEWGLLGLYTQAGPFFFAGAHSLMPQHQMRPIMTTLWAAAFAVDPNSWWFWHFELALSLLIKGASLSWLGLYLTGSRRWAVVCGLLFVVWPADTLQMAFRALNIGMAAGLAPLSAALFVGAYLASRGATRASLALAAAACLVAGTWMYELTLLLAPLPFLVMWAREGLGGTWRLVRRSWQVSVAWLAAVGVCAGYIVKVLISTTDSYQRQVAGDSHQMLQTLKVNAPMLFTHGFARSLFDGWLDAARIFAHDFGSHGYLLGVGVALLLIVISFARGEVERPVGLARIAIVGVIVLALGYGPFLTSSFHLNVTQRTYLFAASGAALIFVAALLVVEKLSRSVAVVGAGVLLALGATQQLWQFREYSANYELEREIIASIVEQVPEYPTGKTLILLDASQRINHTWMLNTNDYGILPSVLTYIYGKPVPEVRVCLVPANVWSQRDAWGLQGSCAETDSAWVFKWAPDFERPEAPKLARKSDVVVEKENAVIVRIDADGHSPDTPQIQANRKALLQGTSVAGMRYRHALAPDTWPFRSLVETKESPAAYRWDFGRRWNLEHPEAGTGWNEAEWFYTPFRQQSAAWISRPHATLVFPLEPARGDYELVLHARDGMGANREFLKASVNGVSVPIQWLTEGDLRATVPNDALKAGMNTLAFDGPVSKEWGVSMRVDWITLAPASELASSRP